MGAFIDLTGKRYGNWTVLERAESAAWGLAMWLCRCSCGKEKIVQGNHLRSGKSKRCQSCAVRERFTTHGETGTRLYRIWKNMNNRCSNENNPAFKGYGGRGITVCQMWGDSFEVFRDWALANGYKKHLTIDRMDNDGDYEPSNCQWITLSGNSKKQWSDRRAKENRSQGHRPEGGCSCAPVQVQTVLCFEGEEYPLDK